MLPTILIPLAIQLGSALISKALKSLEALPPHKRDHINKKVVRNKAPRKKDD